MLGFLSIALASIVLLWLSRTLLALNRNIAAAKRSGIPYRIARKLISMHLKLNLVVDSVTAISGIAGFLWTGIHDPILGLLKSLPLSREWLWPM
jgi:hypothetical protein